MNETWGRALVAWNRVQQLSQLSSCSNKRYPPNPHLSARCLQDGYAYAMLKCLVLLQHSPRVHMFLHSCIFLDTKSSQTLTRTLAWHVSATTCPYFGRVSIRCPSSVAVTCCIFPGQVGRTVEEILAPLKPVGILSLILLRPPCVLLQAHTFLDQNESLCSPNLTLMVKFRPLTPHSSSWREENYSSLLHKWTLWGLLACYSYYEAGTYHAINNNTTYQKRRQTRDARCRFGPVFFQILSLPGNFGEKCQQFSIVPAH